MHSRHEESHTQKVYIFNSNVNESKLVKQGFAKWNSWSKYWSCLQRCMYVCIPFKQWITLQFDLNTIKKAYKLGYGTGVNTWKKLFLNFLSNIFEKLIYSFKDSKFDFSPDIKPLTNCWKKFKQTFFLHIYPGPKT